MDCLSYFDMVYIYIYKTFVVLRPDLDPYTITVIWACNSWKCSNNGGDFHWIKSGQNYTA